MTKQQRAKDITRETSIHTEYLSSSKEYLVLGVAYHNAREARKAARYMRDGKSR